MLFPRRWGSGMGKKDFPLKLWSEFLILLLSATFSAPKKSWWKDRYMYQTLWPLAAVWNVPVPSGWEKGITSSVLGEPNLSRQSCPWVSSCCRRWSRWKRASSSSQDNTKLSCFVKFSPAATSWTVLPCCSAPQIENMLAGKAVVNTGPYAECQLVPLTLWFWYLVATGAGLEPYKIHLPRCHKLWGEMWRFPSAHLWYPVFVMRLSKSCWCGLEDLMESFSLRNFCLDSRLSGCHQRMKLSTSLIFLHT